VTGAPGSRTKVPWERAIAAAILVGAMLTPVWVADRYLIHLWVTFFLFAALAVSWDLIGGYAGQLSLGHATFFALGGYTSVLLFQLRGLTPILGGLVGAVLAAAVAAGIGYVVFRLRGVFFAMSTIAVAEIMRALLLHFRSLTQGDNGLAIPYTGDRPLALMFRSEAPFYYIGLGLLLVTLGVTSAMRRSKVGYYLRAIRDDQEAAESLGVTSRRAKLWALELSATLTALVGAVYAFDIGFINPDSTASLAVSIEIAIMAIIGGVGTLVGPVVGAAVIVALNQATNAWLGARGGASTALYGLLLMATVLIQPAGLVAFYPRGSPLGARRRR
jgi:ABC-type branched-subunit amino acid transport system permease subunit